MVRFLRDMMAGSRLLLSTLLGGFAFVIVPQSMNESIRGAVGWDAGALLFLALTVIAVGDNSPERLRRRAGQQDTKFWIILAVIVVAAAASLASLAFVLQKQTDPSGAPLPIRIIVAALTLVISWIFVHTAFAIRYAHFFYGDPEPKGHRRGGLAFPGIEHPDFWDFIYFSFVVGMTCQVSDVQVTTRVMRRLTLAHGVLSFFFNAGVLAVAVNILAAAL
jgi:uncharacterized membrane protein